jgi:exoribonuclease-2
MITENSLVIYKNKPAIVKEKTDGKFIISIQDGSQVKVRDKDIELIHPGPVKKFDEIELCAGTEQTRSQMVKEVWELLSDEEGSVFSLKDFAVFIFNEYTPSSAYAAYCALDDGLYFSGTIDAIVPRGRREIETEEIKRSNKQLETDERSRFLSRLKNCLKNPALNPLLPADDRFIQDVEALAYGKSTKSRTMKELGFGETPEEAHALLLKTGFWTNEINPYPNRFGLSLNSARFSPDPPPDEERLDLCRLAAFAIDSPWSSDPDDAVSIEPASEGGDDILYVHIADPASCITSGSPAETEARERGVTLYLPEKTVRMLAQEYIPMFALGFGEKSTALTFKLAVDRNGMVKETEIFPSVVKVRRLTYEEADIEMEGDTPDSHALRALNGLAARILKRRTASGAVNIELPEVHISVENGSVKISRLVQYLSASMVRECMIAAGEGAGNWAAGNGLAFPYLSQEADMPQKITEGMAGSFQLRRCMRPRVLSAKPGKHQGLGLDIYTQVTSPLRRYTDLLAHIQIRAFLRGEKTLSPDEVSVNLGFSEAASVAAVHAERASNNHWLMVYLSDKEDAVFDAFALENKGNRWALIIPCLALETQVPLQGNVSPNETVKLALKSVNIARTDAVFVQASGH